MINKIARNALLLLCGGALVVSCNLDYFADATLEEFTWNPSLAIPVGEISYSVQELFDELSDAGVDIGANAEDIVTISYEAELQSQTANGFLNLANQNFNQSLEAGLTYNNPGIASSESFSQTYEFDLLPTQNEEYDSVNFSGGNLAIEVSSEFDAEVDYVLTIRSLVSNASNVPLVLTGTLTPSNPSDNFTEQLSPYLGDFSRDATGNPARNLMVMQLDYDVNIGETSVIAPNDGVSFSMSIANAEFDLVYGFVGARNLDVNFELVNLDFFDAFSEGTLKFASPKFSFVFENSFGFPLGVEFNEIAAITQQGQIINLTGEAANSVAIVSGPEITQIGTTINTTYELNEGNSNIPELISSMPSKVIVEVNSTANPAEAPAQYNFVSAASELNVGVLLELPLIVNINDLVSTENVEFDFGEDLEDAKKLVLRIITENTLPLGGEIELVFRDDAKREVLRVSERPVFDAAPVGSDGRTSSVVEKAIDVSFTAEEIEQLIKATNIDVISRLSSTDASSGQNVKFFSDYDLKVKLAVQADVELTSGN